MRTSIFFILLSCAVFAQGKLRIDIDYARFNYDDTSGYLEIYCAFYQSDLKQVRIGDRTLVKGIIQVKLENLDTKKIFIDRAWQINSSVTDQDTSEKNLNGVISSQLSFGHYLCNVRASDGYDSLKADTLSFKAEISPIPKDRIALSDIELAGSIKKTDKKSDSFFIKNSYEVIPNPALVYGQNLPVLYFYSEFYNLNKASPDKPLGVSYILSNPYNREVVHRNKTISVSSSSVVDVGAINVNKYSTGIYTLSVVLLDSVKNLKVSTSKKFYLLNPGIVDTVPLAGSNAQALSSEFGAMSEDELNRVFDYSRYVTTAREAEEWKKLKTEEGKRQFLVNFWKARRSPADPSKIITWDEYHKRVETANQRFAASQSQGWKTDRGRVFIVYGEPGEVERFPQQSDTKAYEIWHYYEIEGGVIFVFADLQGFGSYTLLHSTKRGELKNDNWQDQIKTD